jgi:heme exporter protein A
MLQNPGRMLTLHDLACAKGERILFRQVQCAVARGNWLHVVGANGIGKTSLLRILCGLTSPAAGEVRWDNTPIRQLGEAYRRELLYVGHDSGLQGLLTARENVQLAATLGGASPTGPQIDAALVRMGLAGREDLPTRFLSQGQKRRVALARLAVSSAGLWVLDEPFVAMDAQAQEVLNELLLTHLDRGGLAVLTSHQPVALGGRPGHTLELAR